MASACPLGVSATFSCLLCAPDLSWFNQPHNDLSCCLQEACSCGAPIAFLFNGINDSRGTAGDPEQMAELGDEPGTALSCPGTSVVAFMTTRAVF